MTSKPAPDSSYEASLQASLHERVRGPAAERLLREMKDRNPVRAGLHGDSAEFRHLFEKVLRLARCRVPVLVVGEVGVGKESVARAIHQNSDRSAGRFVAEACANLREPLLLSRLFGHQRGAFTGAAATTVGLIEQADGGTLFLDEIRDLPPPAQASLVRALESGDYRPLGSSETHRSDFRLITTTTVDLRQLVGAGLLRHDLFYRLRGAVLRVPPLRERRTDILALADQFLTDIASRERRAPNGLAPCARRALAGYSWPGNVRELRHELAQAQVLADVGEITAGMFQFLHEPPIDIAPDPTLPRPGRSLRSDLGEYEATTIRDAIRLAGGNKAEAARRLGITRRTLYRRLVRLDGQYTSAVAESSEVEAEPRSGASTPRDPPRPPPAAGGH